MCYTKWVICDGKIRPIGKQIRSKAICCSPDEGYQGHSIQEWCKQICHLTGEDFQEIRDIPKETSEIYLKVNSFMRKKNHKISVQ